MAPCGRDGLYIYFHHLRIEFLGVVASEIQLQLIGQIGVFSRHRRAGSQIRRTFKRSTIAWQAAHSEIISSGRERPGTR